MSSLFYSKYFKMRFTFIALIFSMAIAISCKSRTNFQTKAREQVFDSTLAAKLGADEYGMKTYVMAILKTGPVKIEDKATRDSIFGEHLKNIVRLEQEGKLVMAGPFLKGGEYRGVFVFDVATIDEARALLDSDPTISSGILTADLVLWYGSAAIMELNNLHYKVAKKSVI